MCGCIQTVSILVQYGAPRTRRRVLTCLTDRQCFGPVCKPRRAAIVTSFCSESAFHLTHHLTSVRLHGDLADAEVTTNLFV